MYLLQVKVKELIGRIWAYVEHMRMKRWTKNPRSVQKAVFKELIRKAKTTQFGIDHHFSNIKSYVDFKSNVPIRDYEALRPYLEEVVLGKENVLWPGKPIYFCKTSGTTSGTKYIPISKESMPGHIRSARNALLHYIHETGDASILNGKMIQLQGSPALERRNGIATGRLSGIVANHVPRYLQKNRLPSYSTNCIEDWDKKIDAIVDETINEDLRLIAGIPIWIQGYFEKLKAKSSKAIKDVFPNLKLLVYGGVNFEPYKNSLFALIGKQISSVEVYPASEGFIAYQDCQDQKGMLLVLNQGMFFEFIPVDEFFSENPTRINIEDVELNTNYVIILNTNAGLWGYNLGDTVKFVSLNPHRIVVTGRLKHFTSAFGEHVIAEEVESAMQNALLTMKFEILEFTVAPQTNPPEGQLPFHEWFIEFKTMPLDLTKLQSALDFDMQKRNSYYKDLIEGKILQPLKITCVQPNGFDDYMKKIGKYGGQNKVPRLSNNREIADQLKDYGIKN